MTSRLRLLGLLTVIFLSPSLISSAEPAKADRTDAQGDPLPPGAVRRIGTVRLRHADAVAALVFSPDGKTLASGAGDGGVSLWDAKTGSPIRRLTIGRGRVEGLCFTPDGKTLRAWGQGGSLCSWEVASGKEENLPKELTGATAATCAANGRTVAIVQRVQAQRQSTYSVLIWDLAAGKELQRVEGLSRQVQCLGLSPDGKLLAVADGNHGGEGQCRVWEVGKGEPRWQLTSKLWILQRLVFSPDGSSLLAVHWQTSEMSAWDAATGKERKEFGKQTAFHAAFTPDGKTLATLQHDGRVVLWDAAQFKRRHEWQAPSEMGQSFGLSPDGQTVVLGNADHTIHLFDAVTGKPRHEFGGPTGGNVSVAFDDREQLLTTGDGQLRRWRLPAGREGKGTTLPQGRLLDLSPDRKVAALNTDLGQTLLLDLATGKELRRLGKGEGDKGSFYVGHAAFSPDGKIIAVMIDEGQPAGLRRWPDFHLRLYDVATGKELRECEKEGMRQGGDVMVSPDGRVIVGLMGEHWGRDEVRIWETATGRVRLLVSGAELRAAQVAFSLDSKLLLAWGEGWGRSLRRVLDEEPKKVKAPELSLWELSTGKVALGLPNPDERTTAACFSPDGRFLATGEKDGTVRVYDLALGKEVRTFTGHHGRVGSLEFSHAGRWLASGSDDVTALVWDVAETLAAGKESMDLAARELHELFDRLAGDDAAKAYTAVGSLGRAHAAAVSFLKDRVRPIPVVTEAKLTQLLTDLDDNRFLIRQRAMKELDALEGAALPALRKLLAVNPPLEVKRRIELILKQLEHPTNAPERLQVLRAIQVLERAGTPDARQLLEELAKGAPQAWRTQEAKIALEGLAKRSP